MKELLPVLEKGKDPLYLQLYRYIKEEIEKASIGAGEKLPSIRSLSDKLGISITTVRTAYDQLMMEGYIHSQDKSGYYVEEVGLLAAAETGEGKQEEGQEPKGKRLLTIYDQGCFDFVKWKKCLSATLSYDADKLLAEADFQGESPFRDQIRKYIFQARGVEAQLEDIVVGAGTQQMINLLVAILKIRGKTRIGFENPGYMLSELIFRNQDFEALDLDLDREGLVLDQRADKLDLLYVSPSHQFPTGTVMSASRRTKLMAWAQQRDGYIIEDDYDSELRYFGRPIPSLKAMDKNDRVIHIGSFSSTLLPSIRISYLVLPKRLGQTYREIKESYSQGVSKVDQLALCKFMEEGHYQRHIKRIRRLYSEKASLLSDYLEQNYKDQIKIISNSSGLFMIVEFSLDMDEEVLAQAFKDQGVKATAYKNYVKTHYKAQKPKILLYFYNIKIESLQQIIEEVMEKLNKSQIS